MRLPTVWTVELLTADALVAEDLFRRERLDEPLARWQSAFDVYEREFVKLFDRLPHSDPRQLAPADVASIFHDHLGDALRYLAAPPISNDDLKILADAASLAGSRLSTDLSAARRVLDVILRVLDPYRFPWLAEMREPTEAEKSAAITASALLRTAQQLATQRRNDAKRIQESAVRSLFQELGFREVQRRQIGSLQESPAPGEFCGESKVGERQADVVVRLPDGRLVVIECKVSNSRLNSVKRVNNDAAAKASSWLRDFGALNVVPVAVLAGVFDARKLLEAQRTPLYLLWGHRLGDVSAFVTMDPG